MVVVVVAGGARWRGEESGSGEVRGKGREWELGLDQLSPSHQNQGLVRYLSVFTPA